ncbi:MAG: hypothetical protein ABEI86_11095 [Halobacteriaceae archaeon]
MTEEKCYEEIDLTIKKIPRDTPKDSQAVPSSGAPSCDADPSPSGDVTESEPSE